MSIGILDLDKKLAIAKAHPKFFCRFHPTDGFHEVGCPDCEWNAEQLLSALHDARAMIRVYQHELFGMPLDGQPVVVDAPTDDTYRVSDQSGKPGAGNPARTCSGERDPKGDAQEDKPQ